jgi:hypothetical protein
MDKPLIRIEFDHLTEVFYSEYDAIVFVQALTNAYVSSRAFKDGNNAAKIITCNLKKFIATKSNITFVLQVYVDIYGELLCKYVKFKFSYIK